MAAPLARFRRPAPLTVGVAALGVAAAAMRLPALFATRHLGFDDGVYGASAVAMRHGAVPFRQVFSSQGPLFLPLVWLADLVGGRHLDSPRLLAVTAGVAVTLATYAAARAAGIAHRRAVVAGALAAASGSVLWVTGPLTSDGPAVALSTATVAVALWYRQRPTPLGAVVVGVLAAATLSVKSLLIGMAVPVGWAMWSPAGGRRPRDLLAGFGVAVALGVVVAAPFGLARVWDQSVRYHLDAAGARTPLANVGKTATTALDRDLPLLAAATAAAVAAAIRRTRARPLPANPGAGDPAPAGRLVAGWLLATAVVLVLEHPLWRNHVAHLVPALAVLVALHPPPARVLVAVAAAATPWHVAHNAAVLWPHPYRPTSALAIRDLQSVDARAWTITDEPGLAWRAGRRTPPDLVDTSRLRIDERRITTASLARAARDRHVCTVLVWSRRFGRLPQLRNTLERSGFVEVRRYDARRLLYAKNGCLLP